MTDQDIAIVENAPALATLATRINAEHQQAETAARSAIEHAASAGRMLIEAKRLCSHGQWLPWLKENVTFKERTAQGYMQLARNWEELVAKSAEPAHLTVDGALKMLAEPKFPTAPYRSGDEEVHMPGFWHPTKGWQEPHSIAGALLHQGEARQPGADGAAETGVHQRAARCPRADETGVHQRAARCPRARVAPYEPRGGAS